MKISETRTVWELLDQGAAGSNVDLVISEGNCKVLKLSDETGEGVMTMYQGFDGVYLMFNDFHMESCCSGYQSIVSILAVDHCREGCMEMNVDNRYSCCLKQGELRIDTRVHHALVAYVSQDNFLFDTTIRENIRMGDLSATDAQVEQAAKDCGCYEFIMGLEHGFDTVVGSGGGHLSGGERQRISIARAMLKNAPIVILDEATANVDPENEKELMEAIDELTKEKTILMIAHRLKTVQGADQILAVDQGRIVQRGTHSELMKENGIYLRFISGRKQAVSWKL